MGVKLAAIVFATFLPTQCSLCFYTVYTVFFLQVGTLLSLPLLSNRIVFSLPQTHLSPNNQHFWRSWTSRFFPIIRSVKKNWDCWWLGYTSNPLNCVNWRWPRAHLLAFSHWPNNFHIPGVNFFLRKLTIIIPVFYSIFRCGNNNVLWISAITSLIWILPHIVLFKLTFVGSKKDPIRSLNSEIDEVTSLIITLLWFSTAGGIKSNFFPWHVDASFSNGSLLYQFPTPHTQKHWSSSSSNKGTAWHICCSCRSLIECSSRGCETDLSSKSQLECLRLSCNIYHFSKMIFH